MFEGEGTAAAADELAARLVALRQAIDLLELEFSTTAAAFAATDAYDRAGSVSAFDWIRHNCKVSGHVTYDRLRVGEQLEKLPTAYLALAEGSIGFAHVSLIAGVAKAVQESPTSKHFDEDRLLGLAAQESVSRFRYTCERARHADDPEGLAFEQFKGVEARRLELLPCEDGLFSLRGVLDPVGAGMLRTALEPLAKRNGRSDARHRERRLADALIELAQHGRKASLMVTTSLETLLNAAGASSAEVEFSTPFSTRTVERLASDCTLTRVLLSHESAGLDVGRGRRVVSPSQRRALQLRDGGCCWPGCERPASWTDAHHLIHWVRGGTTDLGNLVLLCYRHHWMVHEGGWQIVRTDDGRFMNVAPACDYWERIRGPDFIAA
ncbi:MAG: DUF222 domain-containing protein [Chloroflexi bacterium]|nr:MAG: DUF222 domain-containing protein [Chloroflexota bacterium]